MIPDLPEARKVISVGVDIVDCRRLEKALQRQGDRFLEKVFSEQERQYCLAMKNPVPSLAARFAAKEAVAKCFTTGIGEHIGWLSVAVARGSRDEPLIVLDAKAQSLLEQLGGSGIRISLSHTRETAVAFAVMVG